MSSPTEQAHKALRRARLARLTSWLAAAAGLGFVIAFLAQAGLFSALMPGSAVAPPPEVKADQVTAIESTVAGLDREKQPYEVTAARGWQDENVPSRVHLEAPEGSFRRPKGDAFTIKAKTGLYDTEAKTLELTGSVVLEQPERFKAMMDKANIVVEEKRLSSGSPVTAHFGSGTVKANGMQITDDGARILFLNGVKARFDAPLAQGDAN